MLQNQAMFSTSSMHNREKMFAMTAAKPLTSMASEERATSSFAKSREVLHSATRQCSSERKLENISFDLKMEAESLNKWKLSTEMHLQQADKRSSHLAQVTKTQHQTILDLQLDNDSLSTRLQEEERYKEELCQKHETTQALCQIIKMQNDEVVQQLKKFEVLSKELSGKNAYYKGVVEEFTTKFENLMIQHLEMRKDLNEKLTYTEEAFKMRENDLLLKLQKTEDDKKSLQMLVDEHVLSIQKNEEAIFVLDKKVSELTTENSLYKNELGDKETLLEQFYATTDALKKDGIALSEEIAQLKDDKQNLIRETEEKKSLLQEYSEANDILKIQEERLIQQNAQLEQENKEVQLAMKEKEILLQESIDSLKLQETTLLQERNELKQENNDLMKQLNEKESILQTSVNDYDELQSQKHALLQEVALLKKENESLVQEIKNVQDIFQETSNEKDMFDKQLQEKRVELEKKCDELEAQQKVTDEWVIKYQEAIIKEETLKMKNELLASELNKMQNHLEDLSAIKGEVSNQADMLRQEKIELQMEVDKYTARLQEVQGEVEVAQQSLEAETKKHQVDKAALESLSETNQHCLEEIKELKKLVETHNEQVKVLSASNNELQSALEGVVDEKMHTIKDYDILLNTCKTDKVHFEKTLNEKEKFLEDNANKISQLDRQLQSTLSELKQKDAELDSLKAEAGHANKESIEKIKALQRQLEHLAQSKDDDIKSWELKLHVANRTKEVELKALETDNLYNQQVQNQKTQEVLQQKDKQLKALQEDMEMLRKEHKIVKAAEVKMKYQQTEQNAEIESLREQIQALSDIKNSEIATLKVELQSLKHNKEEEILLLQQHRKNMQETLQLEITELKADKEELIQEKQRWLEQLEQQMQQLRPPPFRQAPHLPPSPTPPQEQLQPKTPARKLSSQRPPDATPRRLSQRARASPPRQLSQHPPSATPRQLSHRALGSSPRQMLQRLSNETPRQSVLEKTPKPLEISEDEENGWNKMFSSSPSDDNGNMNNDCVAVTHRKKSGPNTPYIQDSLRYHHMGGDYKQNYDENAIEPDQMETPNPKKKAAAKSPAIPKTPSSNRPSRSEVKEVKKNVRSRKITPEPKVLPHRGRRASTSSSKVSASLIQNSLQSDISGDHLSHKPVRTPRASPAHNLKHSQEQTSPFQSDSSEYIEGELLQKRLSSVGLQVGILGKSPRTPRYDNASESSPKTKKKKTSDFGNDNGSPTSKSKANVRRADNWYRGARKFFKTRPVAEKQLEPSWYNNADDIFKFPED